MNYLKVFSVLLTFAATCFLLISICIARCLLQHVLCFVSHRLALSQAVWAARQHAFPRCFLSFSICGVFVSFSGVIFLARSMVVFPACPNSTVTSHFLQTKCCRCWRKCNHPSWCQRLFPWKDAADSPGLSAPLSDLVSNVWHSRHSSCSQRRKLSLTDAALMSSPTNNAGWLKIPHFILCFILWHDYH